MIMADQGIAIQTGPQRDFAQEAPALTMDPTPPAGGVNVGHAERVISSLAGSALALAGIRMRSLPGTLLAAVGGAMVVRGVTGHCPAYESWGVNTADGRHGAATPEDYYTHGIHVDQALTIEKTPWELYEFWRNFTNLPRFMEHLESVTVIDDKRSHWVARAPSIAGGKVEWDAEIINDEPNALIAWRSLENANVDNDGSVRFVPGPVGRGTEVRVVIDYIPPGGRFGKWVAKLFGEEPSQQIREGLRRFKRLMETGEVPTTQGQPRGDCSGGGKRHSGY
jgi:uncharacterized membrane protein